MFDHLSTIIYQIIATNIDNGDFSVEMITLDRDKAVYELNLLRDGVARRYGYRTYHEYVRRDMSHPRYGLNIIQLSTAVQ